MCLLYILEEKTKSIISVALGSSSFEVASMGILGMARVTQIADTKTPRELISFPGHFMRLFNTMFSFRRVLANCR